MKRLGKRWWPRKRARPLPQADLLPQAAWGDSKQKEETVPDLQVVLNAMRVRLDQTSGPPLSREQLAAKLNDLGQDFDKARASKADAKLVSDAVGIAVQLSTKTTEMTSEAVELMKNAVEAYKQHFPD